MKWCFLGRERERNGRWKNKWRAKGAPHHAMARPGLARATMWCGGMVGPPGLFQVPLYPILDEKNLKTIFWNFSRNFIFEDFQKLRNDKKNTRKRIRNDRKQIQTKSIAALRYSNMQLNSRDKSEQGGRKK
jgi:hypothetical protein